MIKKLWILSAILLLLLVIVFITLEKYRVIPPIHIPVYADEPPLPLAAIADKVLIEKSVRRLYLIRSGDTLKTYHVALGREPEGRKRQEGDGRTPEGRYIIDYRNAASKYYKSLHISYPNAEDRAYAWLLGVNPGGDIMIHGLPNGRGGIGKLHRLFDWTLGCIAVTDEEMDEIWRAVPDGTAIEIMP